MMIVAYRMHVLRRRGTCKHPEWINRRVREYPRTWEKTAGITSYPGNFKIWS